MLSRPSRPGPRPGLAAGLAVAGLLATGGCTGQADPVGAGGIDGLTIPTPTPRPSDFVARVDAARFPLPLGAIAVYRVRPGGATLTTTVVRGPVVQGVATTALRSREVGRGGGLIAAARDLYAQDRSGDVWWFAHATRPGPGGGAARADVLAGPLAGRDWRAGTEGARAGVVMPARLRQGDGFGSVLEPGRVDDRVLVVDVAAAVRTGAGRFDPVAVLDRTTVLGADADDEGQGGTGDSSTRGTVVRDSYAAGVGLVESQVIVGTPYDVTLTAYRP